MGSKATIAIDNILRSKHFEQAADAEKEVLAGLREEFLGEVNGLTDEFGGSKERLAGEIERATEAFLAAVSKSMAPYIQSGAEADSVEAENRTAVAETPREEMNSVEEKVKGHYRGEEGALYHLGKRGISENAYPWAAKLRSEKIGPFIRQRDVVLEYGVGSGWNLSQIECRRKIGFDVSEQLEQVVTSHGIEFITDIDMIADASIDAVLCHHVLEHTVNPAEVLGRILSKLRTGGRLLLFVPYERERCYNRFDNDEPNHHLYSWNVQTLSSLVRECGFAIAQAYLGRYGYIRFAADWAERLRLGEIGFRLIRAGVGFIKPLREVRIIARKDF